MAQRTVVKIAAPKFQREGGGFLARKVIGGVIPSCDPFLMLDHLGPFSCKPGEALGAPDHPHRGFETVTYVIDGGVKHQDSAGNRGVLKSGWVQWMTAGQGIIHSEMPTDDLMKNGGQMEGFQLWVNLPAKLKMIPPKYQDIPPDRIPKVTVGDVTVKVIAGEVQGKHAAIETKTQVLLLDIHLPPGTSYTQTVPETYNGFAYVWRGAGFLGQDMKPAHMGHIGILGSIGTMFKMTAEEGQDCHILLIAGEPIKEPVVKYGPFVMNTEEEIRQAIEDYREGKLGSIPGREERLRQTEAAKVVQKQNGTWVQ